MYWLYTLAEKVIQVSKKIGKEDTYMKLANDSCA